MDFQATDNWRVTGRYMNNKEDILQAYGTTWAGNGSDQLPTPTLFVHPGSNYMLSATGILNTTHVARVELGPRHELAELSAPAAAVVPGERAACRRCRCCFPSAVQADYVPWFVFRGGRTGNAGQYQTDRGPFTNQNITHDVIANLTKVWGAHSSKAGFYFQHSFKPQSIFASFNSQIDFTDNSSNPFDTGLQLRERGDRRVQLLPAGLEVRASRMALQEHRVVRAGQLEAHRAVSRSITACGSTT